MSDDIKSKNFSEEVEQKALRVNSAMAAYIRVLNTHQIVGFTAEIMMKKTLIFLADNRIHTDNNGKTLIWLPSLPEPLKIWLNKSTEPKFNLKSF